MVLVIDNYDSFTFNLVQYLGEAGADVATYRNDAITIEEIEQLQPAYIVISPGPGRPEDAGISLKVVEHFTGKIPILGVCLGHQSIAQAFGGKIVGAKVLVHGKTSEIYHDGQTIYSGISNPFIATRYHSLVAERESIPDCLEITAQTSDGQIMGLRHKTFAVEGVQFHPESVLTQEGKAILRNFLSIGNGDKPQEKLIGKGKQP